MLALAPVPVPPINGTFEYVLGNGVVVAIAPEPPTVATFKPKPVPAAFPIAEPATLSTSFAAYPVPAVTIVALVISPAALTTIVALAPDPAPPVNGMFE